MSKKTTVTHKGSTTITKRYDNGRLNTIRHTDRNGSHYHKVGRGLLGPFTGSRIK